MSYDWTVVSGNSSLLASGLAVSLAITVLSLVAGALLGLAVCAVRLSRFRFARMVATGYINFFRIVPEMVLIFWAYFCLPPIFDLRLSAWLSGTLALALVAAAYLAEIYRAGIEAVPKGQVDAARALGLGMLPLWFLVLLPQAVRRMTPAFLNYSTEVLKNSTLTSRYRCSGTRV
jgi:His/Glu/Gln/Arg/opine family amino acid ABC transporter permease subunit